MKKFLMVAFAAAASLGAAEVHTLNQKTDWLPAQKVTQKDKALVINGSQMLRSKKIFDISTKKIFKLDLNVRNTGKVPAQVFFGFQLYTKDGKRIIYAPNINAQTKTLTKIVRDVKKGDKVIYVGKEGAAWKKANYSYIALNAKADLSDLPNFKVCYAPIKNIEKCAEGYKVTLTRGIACAIAKGTAIRQHFSGGYMYSGGAETIAAGKSIRMQGKVASMVRPIGYATGAWSKYAGKARVILLANWGSKTAVTEFTNAKLVIEDKK